MRVRDVPSVFFTEVEVLDEVGDVISLWSRHFLTELSIKKKEMLKLANVPIEAYSIKE